MNEQNNNFNSQFNNQPLEPQNSLNNRENVPTQPVKNKFFSLDLFEDSNVNDVGSSTSNNVSNKVISWGVGREMEPTISNPNLEDSNQNNNFVANQMLDQVNSVVYTNEQPEILDDMFLNENMNNQNTGNEGIYTMQDSPLFQQVSTDTNSSQSMTNNNFFEQQSNNGNVSDNNDWMNNQPLSMASLGVTSTTSSSNLEVHEGNRFFNSNIANTAQEVQDVNPFLEQKIVNPIILDSQPPEFDEDKMVQLYVGDKYPKFKMSPFSFGAFFFGSFYFMYRKMYFLGVLIFIISILIQLLLSFRIVFIANIVFSIVLALSVNSLYLKIAQKRVKKIIKNNLKKNKNQVALNTICHKKGGTNFILALLLWILCSIAFVIIFMVFFTSSALFSFFNQLVDGYMDATNGEYNGVIVYDSYDITNSLEVVVPSSFVKQEEETFSYVFTTDDTGVFNQCNLSIKALKGFSTGEDFINKFALKEGIEENIQKDMSNDIEWFTLKTSSSLGDVYYRATTVDGKALLLEYTKGSSVTSDICDTYFTEIVLSITEKEE